VSRTTKAIEESLQRMRWLRSLEGEDETTFTEATGSTLELFEGQAEKSKQRIKFHRGRLSSIRRALSAEERTLEVKARVVFGDAMVDEAIDRNNRRIEGEERARAKAAKDGGE